MMLWSYLLVIYSPGCKILADSLLAFHGVSSLMVQEINIEDSSAVNKSSSQSTADVSLEIILADLFGSPSVSVGFPLPWIGHLFSVKSLSLLVRLFLRKVAG